MERSVEVLAIILLGVVGLSHLLQPKGWAEYFILLRGKGEAGAFVDGFLHLPLAGFIIDAEGSSAASINTRRLWPRIAPHMSPDFRTYLEGTLGLK